MPTAFQRRTKASTGRANSRPIRMSDEAVKQATGRTWPQWFALMDKAGCAAKSHKEIVAFLQRKWAKELDYALRKSLWTYGGNRIGVRFQYEWHDEAGQTWRSYGNELWEFADDGLMRRREASINDVAIAADERRIPGPRPESERGLDIPLR